MGRGHAFSALVAARFNRFLDFLFRAACLALACLAGVEPERLRADLLDFARSQLSSQVKSKAAGGTELDPAQQDKITGKAGLEEEQKKLLALQATL